MSHYSAAGKKRRTANAQRRASRGQSLCLVYWAGLAGLLLAAMLAGCGAADVPAATNRAAATVPAADTDPAPLLGAAGPAAVPAVQARLEVIRAALERDSPIIALPDGELDSAGAQAEMLALADARVQQVARTSDGRALRSEVFGVTTLAPGDLTAMTAACGAASANCRRVVLYTYATNSTTVVAVDLQAGSVLDVQTTPNSQPTLIPPHLRELAVQIVLAAPEVAEALGTEPAAEMIDKEAMKTSLTATACERSRHLCVAPTLTWGSQALWAIVDLTEHRLVGLRWTELGVSSRRTISEANLQNEAVQTRYCDQVQQLDRDGWTLEYVITPSDGLEVRAVRFNGMPLLASAKLVDWHVAYATTTPGSVTGYTDAVGCPLFSPAAVVAFNGPQLEALAGGGFALVQDFRNTDWPVPCNYRYEQRFVFHTDGRLEVLAGNLGRGCSATAIYRPVLRVAPAAEWREFAAWDGARWRPWEREQWVAQPAVPLRADGAQFRLGAATTSYLLTAGWDDQRSRGDDAFVYVARFDAQRDEGTSDLATLGSCCNDGYQQGPEVFVNDEALGAGPLVLWYVPQLRNDDRPGQEYCWADSVIEDGVFVPRVWPCYGGLQFVPEGR